MASLMDFDLETVLGQGTYGRVYKAIRKSDRRPCVLKEVTLEGLAPRDREEALNESRLLAQCDHFNIITYHVSFITQNTLYIVMDFASGGDLAQVIREHPDGVEEELVWNYVIQVAQGLKYLHDKRILHRDLKPANVFLDGHNNVKIGDMGLGRILGPQSQFAQTGVGTPLYFSPEICMDRPYNDKSDVWALGCIAHELCTGRPPFIASNQIALAKKICNEAAPPIPPNRYSTELAFLISKMLEKDASKRPDVGQVLSYHGIQLRVERARFRHRETRLRDAYDIKIKELEDRIAHLEAENARLKGHSQAQNRSSLSPSPAVGPSAGMSHLTPNSSSSYANISNATPKRPMSARPHLEAPGTVTPRKSPSPMHVRTKSGSATPQSGEKAAGRARSAPKVRNASPVRGGGFHMDSHLPVFPADAFGLSSPSVALDLPTIAALLAWRRTGYTDIAPSLFSVDAARKQATVNNADDKIVVQKVWQNMERRKLLSPARSGLIVFVKFNEANNTSLKVQVKGVRVCFADGDWFRKIRPPLLCIASRFSHARLAVLIPPEQIFEDGAVEDIVDVIVEFSALNAVEEVVVAEYTDALATLVRDSDAGSAGPTRRPSADAEVAEVATAENEGLALRTTPSRQSISPTGTLQYKQSDEERRRKLNTLFQKRLQDEGKRGDPNNTGMIVEDSPGAASPSVDKYVEEPLVPQKAEPKTPQKSRSANASPRGSPIPTSPSPAGDPSTLLQRLRAERKLRNSPVKGLSPGM